MTSESEIDDQIQRQDIEPYLNKVYDGEVPQEIIEQFRIAVMFLPVSSHGYTMADIKTISEKMADEISFRELGMIINVIYAVPFASMYGSLEEAIEKTRVFDKIREEYNRTSSAFQRRIMNKKNRLMQLSGVGNSVQLDNVKNIGRKN